VVSGLHVYDYIMRHNAGWGYAFIALNLVCNVLPLVLLCTFKNAYLYDQLKTATGTYKDS